MNLSSIKAFYTKLYESSLSVFSGKNCSNSITSQNLYSNDFS